MTTRRRYSPEKRREQLINIGIETCADMGIERTGHGDIAKRADVSTATVFNYFPTKDILMDDLLEEIEARIMNMFDNLPKNSPSAREQVLALYSAYQQIIMTEPATIKTYLVWSVSFNPDLRPRYLHMQKLIIQSIIESMPDGMKTQADALIAYNAANLIAVMIYDNRPAEILQAFMTRLMNALLPES
jgi:TetR/AcrR family hemagglutinin/protease transcriptional regulator